MTVILTTQNAPGAHPLCAPGHTGRARNHDGSEPCASLRETQMTDPLRMPWSITRPTKTAKGTWTMIQIPPAMSNDNASMGSGCMPNLRISP